MNMQTKSNLQSLDISRIKYRECILNNNKKALGLLFCSKLDSTLKGAVDFWYGFEKISQTELKF